MLESVAGSPCAVGKRFPAESVVRIGQSVDYKWREAVGFGGNSSDGGTAAVQNLRLRRTQPPEVGFTINFSLAV